MLKLESITDLQRLVDEKLSESLTLDYKASPSLAKDSKSRDELAKDVSAFANSAGGQIIYGIVEKKQIPLRVDEGSDRDDITPEWIEQVLSSTVMPRIAGIVIKQIPISDDGKRVAYVLTIPAATSLAPHQAPDKKYFRRYNFESIPMHDYEIRDVMNRAHAPDIRLVFDMRFHPNWCPVEFEGDSSWSNPLIISVTRENIAEEPCLYSVERVFFDHALNVSKTTAAVTFEEGHTTANNTPAYVYTKNFNVPAFLPLFKGVRFTFGIFDVRISREHLGNRHSFLLGYMVNAPGFSAKRFGKFEFDGARARIVFTDPAI
ncbi:AlbA family DNA-binding domain-containing protein [Labrys monachus]|uniref:Schlafen AlbA-2 domain-containing protein n=1 Tax=Labrys monachus TaxID=217067 RepID=A0ABU0FBK5_9HYPH|nr:ATP-binding protein [Labrys monachus]MDQ0391816.1 hypothetical protein [Labrys monachus]